VKKIPELEKTVEIPKLRAMNLGGYEFLVNKDLGYYPWYSIELRQRVRTRKVCNTILTGEAGIGKSYQGGDICRVLSRRFTEDDIVFNYAEFLRGVLTTPRGTPVEFDEPSYGGMDKLDWYKEQTKAIKKTIESFRFKGKPLFIPVINKSLLEKNIRSYFLQYHIVMNERGKGIAYKIYPSQFKDKVYNYELTKIRYGLFDNNLCDRDCLAKTNLCKHLFPEDKSKRCMVFRARYERKKISTQNERYEIALEEAEKKESDKLSMDEIEAKAVVYFDKFYNIDKDVIDQDLMSMILERELNIRIGYNKQRRLMKQIYFDHPTLFKKPKYDKADLV